MKKTHAAVSKGGSAISRYRDVVIGGRSFWRLLFYEWCILLSPIPGAIGLFLRKIFWPKLFGSCGVGVVFGTNVIVRHPHRIFLGDRVIISEGSILDARNDLSEKVIDVSADVILSNNVTLSCKNGIIKIGARTGINAQTIIQSIDKNQVSIGADVIIGPHCYVIGGSNYNTDRFDIPIWKQGMKYDGGVTIQDDVWLSGHVTVLGGVEMASGSIAAAGAVVGKSVHSKEICGGVPARVIKKRGPNF
jgi:galactoside O-acetyltransferase